MFYRIFFIFTLTTFLSFCVCYDDVYEISTQTDKIVLGLQNNTLLLHNIDSYRIDQQPIINHQSLIVDTSNHDILFSLKPGSYYRPVINHKKNLVLHIHPPECLHQKPYLHILLDAGHGGNDPGATSATGQYEKEISLSFSLMLKEELEKHPGVKVSLTRDQDMTLSKYARLDMIMEAQPDLLLSIHADAHHKPHASGVGIFILDPKKEPSISTVKVLQQFSQGVDPKQSTLASSADVGQSLLNTLSKNYPLHDAKPKKAPLVVLRSPNIASILVELGFISNPQEAALLSNKTYLYKLSADMSAAILQYWDKQWRKGRRSGE